MFYVENNNITMTKGDSGSLFVKLSNPDGSEYVLNDGDSVVFSVKKRKESSFDVLLKKTGCRIDFNKKDTEKIPSGKYFYDVAILRSAGERYTAAEGILEIRKAVHDFE